MEMAVRCERMLRLRAALPRPWLLHAFGVALAYDRGTKRHRPYVLPPIAATSTGA